MGREAASQQCVPALKTGLSASRGKWVMRFLLRLDLAPGSPPSLGVTPFTSALFLRQDGRVMCANPARLLVSLAAASEVCIGDVQT